jgi:hypothetical protein
MSSNEDDPDSFAHGQDDDGIGDCGADALFGCYAVLAPGVQIVLDGRPVSAPAAD